ELAAPGEEGRAEEGTEAGRRQELEAVRQRVQPAAEPDEDAPEPLVGAHQAVLDPEAPAEVEGPGLLGQEEVGPGLDQKARGALGGDRPAQPGARLQQRDLQRVAPGAGHLDGAVSGRQPRDPAAHHHQPHRGPRRPLPRAVEPPASGPAPAPGTPVPAWARTRSASAATNAGWSLTAPARCRARP